MKKIITRFGEVEYDPTQTVIFPNGLLGFESLREFIVMPNLKDGPLFWIQSVDDPAIAFVLTDPTNFFPTYKVEPDANERKLLQLGPADECFVLTVVTIHPDKQVTLNLAAPVLYAPRENKAMQVILEKTEYQTRTPLPVC